MDKFTILFFLEQLCEKEMMRQINQSHHDSMAIKNLMQIAFSKEPHITQATSFPIAMRDFEYRLIQANYESVRCALTQLNALDESIMLIMPNLSKDSLYKLKLIEVLLLDTERDIKKIALLEMKQVIVQLMHQLSIDETLSYLLQHDKINYRYFLGYETTSSNDIIYYQTAYRKCHYISIETNIERKIYQRRVSKNKSFDKLIAHRMNEEMLKTIQNSFYQWKENFLTKPIPNESLETICDLWTETINEVKQIHWVSKKESIEGQLDLWNYQKIKLPTLGDSHNH